jgi:hypothetical protein
MMARSRGYRQDEFSWRLASALFGVVVLAILLMLGFGFALAWLAGKFA